MKFTKKRCDAVRSRPSALVIAPEAPYPLHGGGPLRTASLIGYLARSYDIDVVTFREMGANNPLDALPEGVIREGRLVNLKQHAKTSFARIVRNLSRALRGVPPLNDRFGGYDLPLPDARYALALVEHFWCAGYVDALKPHCDAVWLDLHNIESELFRSRARGVAAPLMHRFARSTRRLERELLPRFSGILVASDADAQRVEGMTRTVIFPNTIPYTPLPSRAKRREIVFSGNLEYDPNIRAVRYFRTAVWPLIRARIPDVQWRIIGRNPHGVRDVVEGDPRIELSGPVGDAIYEISAAQVAVAPLLSGSGTRVKIIEAWAAGAPVVSTSIGAEGLPGLHGQHLLIADDPAAFADTVILILESPPLAARLARAGRALYEQHLTWERAWEALSIAGL